MATSRSGEPEDDAPSERPAGAALPRVRLVGLPPEAGHAHTLAHAQARVPMVSIGLAALLLAIYAASAAVGALDDLALLGRLGARAASRLDLEPWRLLTANLLHGGVMHVATNSVALIALGLVGEGLVGGAAWLTAFVVTAIAAQGLGSLLAPAATLSVGASGPVFGLAGFLLGALLRHRRRIARPQRALVLALAIFAAWSLGLGFLDPGLDGWAHVGGLAAGLLLGVASVTSIPGSARARRWWRIAGVASIGVLGAAAGLQLRALAAPLALSTVALDAPGVTLGVPADWRPRALGPRLLQADDGLGGTLWIGRVELAPGDAAATARRALATVGHASDAAELPAPAGLRVAPVDLSRKGRTWLVWPALRTPRGLARLAFTATGGRAWFVLGWAPRAAAPRYARTFEAVEAAIALP